MDWMEPASSFLPESDSLASNGPNEPSYPRSSNGVVARSTSAGGHLYFMDSSDTDEKIIRMLLPRLERISVDSYWAHRASGVRGALTKLLDQIETGEDPSSESLRANIRIGFEILREAAQEYM